MTDALPAAPHSATGLVHLGHGRYYDPALGRPLQPNTAGGPPTLPQALNRYSATSLGQPGVGQAAVSSGSSSLLLATGLNAISAGSGMALSAYANHLVGDLLIQANSRLLSRAGYEAVFRQVMAPGRGRSAYYLSSLVKAVDDRTYQVIGTGQVIRLDRLEAQVLSQRWLVKYPTDKAFSALDDNLWKQLLRSSGGEFGANLAVNLVLSYGDLSAPWQNPYFNDEQRLLQNGVTVSGAVASAGAAVAVGSWAAVAGIGGPATFVLVTGTGVVVYVTWEYGIKPAVSWITVNLFDRSDPYQEFRSLEPLR